jgi:predicted porin
VYDLHDYLKEFSYKKGKMECEDLFSQGEKLNHIAYVADMFGLLNELNVSLQGQNSSITDLYDKMKRRHTCFQLSLQRKWNCHRSE